MNSERHGDPALWSDKHGLWRGYQCVCFQRQRLCLTQCCDLNVSALSVKDLDIAPATLSHLVILVGHLPHPTIIVTCV